jgi:3-hydroxyisobutyrate dehydrogenase-like beta-hydroxyacid dehydrogenase
MATVAFLGLGVMGSPMAGHLQAAGHNVRVWNRTAAKADAWTQHYGGYAAKTITEAVQDCDLVFACVGADKDVAAITTGPDGAFAAMKSGAVFVDHTTISAEMTRKLHADAARLGLGFLDAPVSGGQAGAQNGQLTIMVGGEAAALEIAAPVMQVYAKRIGHMGASGAGQLAKMVNQICIAGIVQGLAEAVHFAIAAELPTDLLFDVLSKGAAQSWQMENRVSTMVQGQYDFGFAVDWMRKDLGLVLEQAQAMGIDLPMTRTVDGYYADVQALGGGRNDTSSLLRRLRASV